MNIGYPCINRSLPICSSTFRLASYSEDRLITTVEQNLTNLLTILQWNVEHTIFFFRISSDLIPFASHSICTYPWQEHFKKQFEEIGEYIKENKIRTSMHPDQFTLINSPSEDIFQRSIAELKYHCLVFTLMKLDTTHKIQIHVGGAYGNKEESMLRFISRFHTLPQDIKDRLAIENDDRLFTVKDCFAIHKQTNIPIIFDNFHHSLNNTGEEMKEAANLAFSTWTNKDGIPIMDYSSQQSNARRGAHTEHINLIDFLSFIKIIENYKVDIMFEIKDKEISVLEALDAIDKV